MRKKVSDMHACLKNLFSSLFSAGQGVQTRAFVLSSTEERRDHQWLEAHLLEELDEREASAPLGAVVAVDGHALDHAELGEVRRELLLGDVHSVLALSQPADEHLGERSGYRGGRGGMWMCEKKMARRFRSYRMATETASCLQVPLATLDKQEGV